MTNTQSITQSVESLTLTRAQRFAEKTLGC